MEIVLVPIGVLVSGRGSNLEAILDAVDGKYITKGEVRVVVSNKPGVGALEIAKKHGVPTAVLDDKGLPKMDPEYDAKTMATLEAQGANSREGLAALAGCFRLLRSESGARYQTRLVSDRPP